jgi:hypothetical protein
MAFSLTPDPVPDAPFEELSPVKVPAIPTGFPEPATVEPPRPGAAAGNVILATVPPLGALHVPSLDDGGEEVVITEYGTEVTADVAQRAHEAAALAGLRLKTVT